MFPDIEITRREEYKAAARALGALTELNPPERSVLRPAIDDIDNAIEDYLLRRDHGLIPEQA